MGIKILTRLSVLFTKMKSGNNSNKLESEINKYYIFCINTIKSPKNLNNLIQYYDNGTQTRNNSKTNFCFVLIYLKMMAII